MGKKRTAPEQVNLKEDLKGYFAALHQQMQTDEMFYSLQFGGEIDVEEGWEPSIPPTAATAIDSLVDSVDTEFMRIDVPSRNQTQAAMIDAELARKFYIGNIFRIEMGHGPLVRPAAKHLGIYGMSVIKTFFDGDRWPSTVPRPAKPISEMVGGEEGAFKADLRQWLEKKRMNYPIAGPVINPQLILWDPSNFSNPSYVIHIYERPAIELVEKYPEMFDSMKPDVQSRIEKGMGQDLISWMELWDDEFFSYFVDDQPVKWNGEEILNIPHQYGFNPYSLEYAGFGNDSAAGKPEDRIKGILWDVRSTLVQEAASLTYNTIIQKAFAWPNRRITYPKNQGYTAEGLDKIFGEGFGPGAQTYHTDDVQVTTDYPQLPSGGPWRDMQMTARDYTERATVNPVLSGVRPLGSQSGFDTSLSAAFAKNKTKAVVYPLQRLLQKFNEKSAMLIQNRIRDEVTVWAQTPGETFDEKIGPDVFKGHFTNYVHLSAISKEERMIQARLGQELWLRGMISRWLAKSEYAGIPNPLEDDKRMHAERFQASPTIARYIEQESARQLGIMPEPTEGRPLKSAALMPTDGDLPFGSNQGMPPMSQFREFESPRAANQPGMATSEGDIDVMRNQRMQQGADFRLPQV